MIGQLSGILIDKNTPPQLVVDCHGVGYEVEASMNTFYNLPEAGAAVRLWTHLVVREDAQILFGFDTVQERSAFKQLIKISGVGPRTALSILSGLSVADLSRAVSAQDDALLTRVPGIGKKTAARLLLELKGKLAPDLSGGQSGPEGALAAPAGNLGDVLQALVALGYSDKQAHAALKVLPTDVEVTEGVRLALRRLAG